MRGRYMGLYGLTWSVAFGIGPVLGGWLNDNIAPVMIWVGGLAAGLLGVAGFLLLWRKVGRHYGEMAPVERHRADGTLARESVSRRKRLMRDGVDAW